MALGNQALLIISISSLLLSLSAASYYDVDTPSAPSVSPSSAPISYISSTPDAAPGSSPSTAPSTAPVDAPPDQVSQYVESNMAGTLTKTQEFLEAIRKRINNPSTDEYTLECLKTCEEVYGAAVDDMKNTIDDVSSGDYYKANIDLSAVSTNVDTCDQCFEEMVGEDPEFKKFDDWVREVAGNALAALDKYRT
ncbi:hypothetical protein RJ640_021727 [Escallonia rubra]|uniref:Pectinesterase inhibitor domain-containing protein n=1 Tax=Escallonia rubra TaxID=112253 RepID=A0AA88U1C3_9ASTE|nr:hypothetical protein RJ640_021727 [Escallonia rubra]